MNAVLVVNAARKSMVFALRSQSMPVYSMTGYAAAQSSPEHHESNNTPALGIEIRSVNSRFLDVVLKLPDDLRFAEPGLREWLTTQVRRGKIEIRMWLEQPPSASIRQPSVADLQRLVGIQDGIKAWLPNAQPLGVAEVLALTTSRQTCAVVIPIDSISRLFDVAVADFKAARAREGARLQHMLQSHVQQLQNLVTQAQPLVPELIVQQRQKFLDRWAEALKLSGQTNVTVDAAQDRALSEATAFAIRIDVAEELTRLQSHLQEIDRLLTQGGELGKRLDFLIQELHREANTLGSKSSSLELTRISMDMKVLIEQMREQVQNLE
jgi:uncharacterized protein (TIGR00255 family)